MKPTKNRVYCKDSGRKKMLFETEKKANTFIKFNSEEIAAESGFGPSRSYFCIFCNGWHVTSKAEPPDTKSTTEVFLDRYREEKEKKLEAKVRAHERRKERIGALVKHFEAIRKQIEALEQAMAAGSKEQCIEIYKQAVSELELAKTLHGRNGEKKLLEGQLSSLQQEIQKMIS